MTRATVLLVLLAVLLFGAVRGLRVGLLADPLLTNQKMEEPTDSYEGYEGGGALMARLLEDGEHTISTVDSVEDEETWSQVLSSVSVFVFPTVNPGMVVSGFSEVVTQALNTFMEEGGVIVWSSSSVLCNQTFQLGWTAPTITWDLNSAKTPDAAGTPFESAPETLEALRASEFVFIGTVNQVCYYTINTACTVMSVSRGEGHLVFLGWDFVSFDPDEPSKRDLITPKWEQVFAIAVEGFTKEEANPSSSSAEDEDGSNSSNSSSGDDGAEDGDDGSAANTLRSLFLL
ncbi:hypothetical protein QOT17_011903 [Balamuthia mandrillaris]